MTSLRVFIPFALGYFLSYLMRVINAVIAPDLVRELGLTAADLGLLTSANFLAFAVAQLPLGILLDRYGPRRTEAVLLLFAALGAFLFATAASAPGLIAGRALIGLGTSACLMRRSRPMGCGSRPGASPSSTACRWRRGAWAPSPARCRWKWR